VSVTRRELLEAGAGGLVLGFVLPRKPRLLMAEAAAATAPPATIPVNAFLRIGTDDTVTVLINHSEMGQGVWTGLPMIVAEELEADWSKIRVEHAPAAPVYAHALFGIQATGGSTSTWTEFDRLRRVGAAARMMLIQAAAKRWKVSAADLRAENGFVFRGDEKLSYGKLAADAAKQPVPADPPLKDRKDWKIIGKNHKRLDTPDKITGRARYGIDVKLPGLLTATVERSPVFGGKVKSFSADEAKKVPGVRKVVEVPTGVAVVADHFWAAQKGREALKVEWDLGENATLDTDKVIADYRELVKKPGAEAAKQGDVDAALAGAARKLEAVYEFPYLAHAPMEPLNATVRIEGGKCEIWAGTQFQGIDQVNAGKICGIKPENVSIHTMFLGGGFGRRATVTSDFISEAVHVAKAVGKPVKTVWTREDDIHGGYYRPLFVHRIEAGLDKGGKAIAWKHAIAGQPIRFGPPTPVDQMAVEGVADSPYLKQIAAHHVSVRSTDLGVPVLWWRSVGHTHTAFAMESFVDELAAAMKRDPLELRRELLKDAPRRLKVLEAAAEKAGWGQKPPAGIGRGLAVHESFGSIVAQVADVSVDAGKIRVHRVVCAIDCGTAVNPDAVVAQMQGGIIYGLSAALYGAVHIKEGRVQESNFDDYQVVRMPNAPKTEEIGRAHV